MADPLSVAGSVVGITTAGVQASVKLYALAEKVVTASQRVTSIADDVSSTCAILNQVRELIIPQPDAQGTLKSVFNSVALSDISHALQRCRSVFTEIEILLRQAFEQVGKRHASRSKVQLSRFEKAKWPFLQPQFDELRTDLRDSKSNLMLMVAVASLALARRDGHQRPVHDSERLELGSAIVQLQQARTMETNNGNTSANFSRQKMGLLKHFGIRRNVKTEGHSMAARGLDTSREHIPGSRAASTTQASPSKLHQDATVSSVVGRLGAFPPRSDNINLLDASPAPDRNARTQEQELLNNSSLSHGTTETNLANLSSISGFKEPARLQTSNASYGREAILSPGQDVPEKSKASSSTSDSTLEFAVLNTSTATPSDAHVSDDKWYYQGWSTDYLIGLRTGYGDSLFMRPMNLPDQSLERLVKGHEDQDLDPYVTMLGLTQEQRIIITRTCATQSEAQVAYVSLHPNTTISSVFGVLEIITLKWIVKSRTPFPPEISSPSDLTSAAQYAPPVEEAREAGQENEQGEIQYQRLYQSKPRRINERPYHGAYHGAYHGGGFDQSFGIMDLSSPHQSHHCGGGSYNPSTAVESGGQVFRTHETVIVVDSEPTIHQEPVLAVGQVGAEPARCRRPPRSRKGMFSRFREQRDKANYLQHPSEVNEDDIVDELLARWTNFVI